MRSKIKKSLYTYDPKKNKKVLVGVYTYGFFFKTVSSKHFMIKEQGYGIQEDVIEQLKELGCERVYIKTPTHIYRTEFSEWLEQDIKNYGHGNQRFLSVAKTNPVTYEQELSLF